MTQENRKTDLIGHQQVQDHFKFYSLLCSRIWNISDFFKQHGRQFNKLIGGVVVGVPVHAAQKITRILQGENGHLIAHVETFNPVKANRYLDGAPVTPATCRDAENGQPTRIYIPESWLGMTDEQLKDIVESLPPIKNTNEKVAGQAPDYIRVDSGNPDDVICIGSAVFVKIGNVNNDSTYVNIANADTIIVAGDVVSVELNGEVTYISKELWNQAKRRSSKI